jgi:asparagine synthase (glutamine-hydrolysing)
MNAIFLQRFHPDQQSTMKDVYIGRPSFDDPHVDFLMRERGPAAAWHSAYARYGVQAAAHARGAFAVGFSPAPGVVYLAVDRFARETMCYTEKNGIEAFGTKADLLAQYKDTLDPQALYDYLHFHVIPSPNTVFHDVKRVPAAHYVHFKDGVVTSAPYWWPMFRETRAPHFPALSEEFNQLLKDAVARTLKNGKAGCYLSGGTDSSTVSGIASKILEEPIDTFSIGFDAAGYDEMEYARIAARHFGTRHYEYYVTPEDLVNWIPTIAGEFDQPFGNSSSLPSFMCAKLAREHGIQVMLAGDGGDELFGGNTRYAKQKIFQAYQHLPHFLRSTILEPLVPALSMSPFRKAGSYIEQAMVPMPMRATMGGLLERIGPQTILTSRFLATVDQDAPGKHENRVWSLEQNSGFVNHMLGFDWRYTLAENDLRKVTSTASIAGIRVAFPLLDETLVDFSMKLPESYKVRGMTLRWFFKKALKDLLPEAIIKKKKHGFGLPFGLWALENKPLFDLASESVYGLVDRDIVRADFAKTLMKDLLKEHPGYYGEMVWILMMLEQWIRTHQVTIDA